MSVQELFEALHQLETEDQFRAVQLLLKDISTRTKYLPQAGSEYEWWSQTDSADGAAQLLQIMRDLENRLDG